MRAFQNIHPVTAFIYFVCVLLIAMFIGHPIILAESLVGAVLFCLMLECGKGFLKNMAFYIPLFLLVSLTNPLFSHNGMTPLFFMNGNPVTLEAVLYGVAISAMLVGVIYWFKCYSFIFTSDKFLYLFGKIIPKLSLILSMALRFIPMFQAQIKRVNKTQKAMGLYTSKSLVDRFRSATRVFYVMIQWSLENAVETGNSMRARGYGLKGRTHFSLFRFTARDGTLLGLSVMLAAAVLIGKALGGAHFAFYPRIAGNVTTPLSIIIYIAFGGLSLLPFILESEENLKWKYLVSKI